jgi:hypothetical protein
MNFTAQKLQAQHPVHLIHSRNREGESCYFVLRASPVQFQKLMAKKQKGSVDVSQFGEILASGFGKAPSAKVRAQLAAQHGITLENL